MANKPVIVITPLFELHVVGATALTAICGIGFILTSIGTFTLSQAGVVGLTCDTKKIKLPTVEVPGTGATVLTWFVGVYHNKVFGGVAVAVNADATSL